MGGLKEENSRGRRVYQGNIKVSKKPLAEEYKKRDTSTVDIKSKGLAAQ